MGEHINDVQLRRQTARDTIQYKPIESYKFGMEHPLSEAIHIDASGKLAGDVGGLSSNGLYKLGEDHFVHIQPDLTNKEKFGFTVYKKSATGEIENVIREACSFEGEFEHKLTELIKQKGALAQSTEQEVLVIAEHLQKVAKGVGDEAHIAGHYLDQMLHTQKPKIPEGMGTRLQQAAEGTLRSFYTDYMVEKPRPPRAKLAEAPKPAETVTAAENAAGREATSAATSTAESAEQATTSSGAAATENAAARTEGAFTRFMKNEKWMGKKGLVVVGGTVAVGAIAYGASKMLGKNQEPQEAKPWINRVSQPTTQQKSL